jgi:hypothetical protein
MLATWKTIMIVLSIKKNRRTSAFVDCFVMKNVEIEYPSESDKSKAKIRRDFAPNIYRLGNHMLGSLLAALMVRQKPKLHKRVPNRK